MHKARTRLIESRRKLEMTQEEVAKILGVSRTFYNEIEKGKKNPRFETTQKMVLLFNLDINSWE